jgi:hypothetical protein
MEKTAAVSNEDCGGFFGGLLLNVVRPYIQYLTLLTAPNYPYQDCGIG